MTEAETDDTTTRQTPGEVPEELRSLPAQRVLDLDVREDLRNGREPFSRIMSARAQMPADGVLRVRAIFEPVPLYRVMAQQGLSHWTEELAPDDWRIWFFDPSRIGAEPDGSATDAPAEERPGHSGASAKAAAGEGAAASREDDDVVVLDVRGLEPPEPLVRTLEALEELPPGSTLLHINVREPVYLFPRLEERGATWEVREQAEDLVRVFIRKPSP